MRTGGEFVGIKFACLLGIYDLCAHNLVQDVTLQTERGMMLGELQQTIDSSRLNADVYAGTVRKQPPLYPLLPISNRKHNSRTKFLDHGANLHLSLTFPSETTTDNTCAQSFAVYGAGEVDQATCDTTDRACLGTYRNIRGQGAALQRFQSLD